MEEEQAGIHKTRDFICSCGKNYLSYAALFTHIKQKHDGKAPGPIVRPRSERKRGRPRKNPLNDQQLRNSDSDGPINGISIANEINNNINIYQKKAKQAAQLLGCGQFQAFQAYKPDYHMPTKQRNEKDMMKKPSLKKSASGIEKGFQKVTKEQSSSSCEAPKSLNQCRSAPSENKNLSNDNCSYQYNFVIKHLMTLFRDYQPTQQEYSCRQIIQIFDIMSQDIDDPNSQKKKPENRTLKLSIQEGFKLFLSQIQDSLEEFEFKQISFLLSLFYEHISQKIGKPSNLMKLGLQVSEFTKYITSFLNEYLPERKNELSVSSLHIFKQINPTNIMMCLCNWISIRQMQQSIKNRPLKMLQQEKEEHKVTKSEIPKNQICKQKQSSEASQKNNCSSQEQIEFQQINAVLQMAKSIKNRTTVEQDKEEAGKNKEEVDDDNELDEVNISQGGCESESYDADCVGKDEKNIKQIDCLAVLK